nr:serine/arginine repetitive matrix protein 1-like [Aegilops tauschii subsp. strangulata]
MKEAPDRRPRPAQPAPSNRELEIPRLDTHPPSRVAGRHSPPLPRTRRRRPAAHGSSGELPPPPSAAGQTPGTRSGRIWPDAHQRAATRSGPPSSRRTITGAHTDAAPPPEGRTAGPRHRHRAAGPCRSPAPPPASSAPRRTPE